MQKSYKIIQVVFDEMNKDEMKLYNKVRELDFKNKIQSYSGYIKSLIKKDNKM